MIRFVMAIDWRSLWRAMKAVAALFGAAGIAAWFAVAWPWYVLILSAFTVAGAVFCAYMVCTALEARRLRRRARRELGHVDNRLARMRAHRSLRRRASDLEPSRYAQSWLDTLEEISEARGPRHSPPGMVNLDELPPSARRRVLEQIREQGVKA
jgi:hypothetical protein